MNPIFITHANCNDGKWSAVIASMFYGEGNVEIVYAVYHSNPPDVTGRDVVIADFSYSREVLLDMHDKANTLIVLDHHASSAEDLEGLDFCIFDMNHSGAVLTWLHFYPDQEVPKILLHVQDHDLWRFEMPDTKAIVQGMWLNTDLSFDVSDLKKSGGASNLDKYRDDGTILLLKQDIEIPKIAKKAHSIRIGGHVVPAVNSNTYISELGNVLSDNTLFAVVYQIVDADHVSLSFRSRYGSQEQALDVSKIAAQFGGGGHKAAAGGVTSLAILLLMCKWAERLE